MEGLGLQHLAFIAELWAWCLVAQKMPQCGHMMANKVVWARALGARVGGIRLALPILESSAVRVLRRWQACLRAMVASHTRCVGEK
jgi:hypothetical protein